MPSAVVPPAPQTTATATPTTPPLGVGMVPFVRAGTEVNEPIELDKTNALGGRLQLGPADVVARGYMANLVLIISATGGTGTAAVYKADAPWSLIESVSLTDVGGGEIITTVTGYELYLMHKWGGYAYADDPTKSYSYIAPTTAGNFQYIVRIPVRLRNRDQVGALANQSASQTYKLHVTQADKGDVYSTPATGLPNVQVRGFLEAVSVPNDLSAMGAPQATQPPAHGTTQNWSKEINTVASGNQKIKIARVGNLIRSLVLIFRDNSGVRQSSMIPTDLTFSWDGRPIFTEPAILRKHYMYERTGHSNDDSGVLVYDFDHEFMGRIGSELSDLYLPTTQSSRLEIRGTLGSAGTVTTLVNDVIPQGDIYQG